MSLWWLLLAVPMTLLTLLSIIGIIGEAIEGEDEEFGGMLTIGALAACFAVVGWVGVTA